ncbi:sulfite reductase (NADPH) flavoprotein alpha-component [Hymenobacter luteus]|uniref:assimilatory sulfite reductase (NADPH) n=2 Tax=Hymenobacter TaxID=89966 RepID=A0A7W9SYU4_9BACT|nr:MULTISPECIES: assimilatory sulfite reductase (NADPH) flavoprotein subunit [Hymenobacter]MBB4601352.1 sulfite reductase (NADPH) flavoprotein alpha-component [Hymenobacter latericoloratus]MBB6058441.1 sulfite reductase (NADPH) flavoprotein alpha-component [Hymenobacter luteus]
MSSFSSTLPIGFDEATLQQLTAGLSDRQLLWLSGYLYGRAGTDPATAASAPAAGAAPVTAAAPVAAPSLTILYGSQTGNSKKAAGLVAEAARQRGLPATVRDMNDYPPKDLKTERHLLVVVSTQGEGDPPIAAEELHQFLLSNRAPKLPELRFAVLALGDKSYLQFCQTGFEFDQRLAELGATRLLERVDCDVEFEAEARRWAGQVLGLLAESLPQVAAPVAASAAAAPVKPVAVSVVVGGAEVELEERVEYHSRNPFEAELLEKIQLNGRGSTKETYHLEFSLADSGIQYEAGDALMVQPRNRPGLVQEVLDAARLEATAPVRLETTELDLTTALTERLELSVVTRDVLERYAALAPHYPKLREILADKAALPTYLYGRDVADLLQEFPVELSGQQLAAVLRPLPARAYSIASSLLAHPEEVHLTVGAVRYQSNGRAKHGACSSFQADQLHLGDTARVWVDRNEYFKLPQDPGTDIIMVGAGTGVAPFRAFVEERAETGATGQNWLVFGNPHFTTDFLYQTEWLQHLKRGTLHQLDVAFSRDQQEKIYIQHRLLQQSRRLYDQLENGATFYVCGDKTRMAADVQRALLTVISQESGQGETYAADYLKQLRKSRRYLEDVY